MAVLHRELFNFDVMLFFLKYFKNLSKHPKGLYTVTFIEVWERFSFYGMRFCLVLYMVKDMMLSQQKASYIYGLYCSFAYFAPLICGYIADTYTGQRKAITIGSWCRFFGLLLLSTGIRSLFVPSLALIIIATGFMRAGMNPLVGMMYDKNDDFMRDAGFRIFYIFANVGALFSVLICGYIGQEYSYRYAFLVAGVSIMIGQINYILTAKKTLGDLGLKPISMKKIKDKSNELKKTFLTKVEKIRLFAMFIIFFVFINVFDICYEQQGNTITLFVDKYVDRQIGNFTVPVPWFHSMNPIIIWIFTPLLGLWWQKKAKAGKYTSYVNKFTFGLFLLGISYIVLMFAGYFIERQETISMLWIIAVCFMQTMGEIYVFPTGYSLIVKLSPKKLMSLCFGFMSLEICVANFLSCLLGGLYSSVSKMYFFSIFTIILFVFVLLLLLIGKKLTKMIEMKETV